MIWSHIIWCILYWWNGICSQMDSTSEPSLSTATFRSYRRMSALLRAPLTSLPVLSIHGITSKMFDRASWVRLNSSLFIIVESGLNFFQSMCVSSYGSQYLYSSGLFTFGTEMSSTSGYYCYNCHF